MIKFIRGAALPLSILFAGLLAVATSANADTIRYYSLVWSPFPDNTNIDPLASATGTIGLDLTALPNPSPDVNMYNDVVSFSVTAPVQAAVTAPLPWPILTSPHGGPPARR